MGVDPAKGYALEWALLPKKKEDLRLVEEVAAGAKAIILATDPDREGEGISWHLLQHLQVLIHLNAFIAISSHMRCLKVVLMSGATKSHCLLHQSPGDKFRADTCSKNAILQLEVLKDFQRVPLKLSCQSLRISQPKRMDWCVKPLHPKGMNPHVKPCTYFI